MVIKTKQNQRPLTTTTQINNKKMHKTKTIKNSQIINNKL